MSDRSVADILADLSQRTGRSGWTASYEERQPDGTFRVTGVASYHGMMQELIDAVRREERSLLTPTGNSVA